MIKIYKLACNFNQVEFEMPWDTPDDIAAETLQREYDLLAGINTVAPANTVSKGNKTPQFSPPVLEKASASQIEWAKNLGMKNPEQCSKKEVWKFIQENKKNV